MRMRKLVDLYYSLLYFVYYLYIFANLPNYSAFNNLHFVLSLPLVVLLHSFSFGPHIHSFLLTSFQQLSLTFQYNPFFISIHPTTSSQDGFLQIVLPPRNHNRNSSSSPCQHCQLCGSPPGCKSLHGHRRILAPENGPRAAQL